MPADARSLLRAAAAQRRTGIQDRWASYHPTTQALRCVACAYLPIKHESLWSSHAASKSHRNNVTRLLQDEQAAAAAASKGKRKQSEDPDTAESDVQTQEAGSSGAAAEPEAKRARLGHHQNGNESITAAKPVVDEDEWARFQREVLEAPVNGDAGSGPDPSLDNAIHAAATISAEPVLLIRNPEDEEEDPEGMDTDGPTNGETQDAPTEEELRLEREREEREEILMRFEEEQRVQDEAEERVNALKNRVRDFKAARIAKQGGASTNGSSTEILRGASSKARSTLGKQFSKALSSRSKS